ncbi:MAG: nickel-binding protein [Leptolyngbyaceae cyanobacterium]
MALIVVETTYDPPIDQALWDALLERGTPCMAERDVTWKRTYLSRDRRRSICELEAADAETVRATYQRGDIPYDRIWSADLVETLPTTI